MNLIEMLKLNKSQIINLLPHREPMLLIDELYDIVDLTSATAVVDEKKNSESGLINAGIYVLRKDIFKDKKLESKFSFEKDFLNIEVKTNPTHHYISDGFFIDIGIPIILYIKAKKRF